jgi:hypothetical protein
MDNIGRGREGPTVGLGRGKLQHSYTRSQTKVESDEHHRVLEGNSGHEEAIDIFERNTVAKARETSGTRTLSRTSNKNDHTVGGRDDK